MVASYLYTQPTFLFTTSPASGRAGGVDWPASGCLRVLRALVESPLTECAFCQLPRDSLCARPTASWLREGCAQAFWSLVTSTIVSRAPCVRVNCRHWHGARTMFIVLSSDIYLYETKYPGSLRACVVWHTLRCQDIWEYFILYHTLNDPLIYRHFLLILSHIPGASYSNIRTVSNTLSTKSWLSVSGLISVSGY